MQLSEYMNTLSNPEYVKILRFIADNPRKAASSLVHEGVETPNGSKDEGDVEKYFVRWRDSFDSLAKKLSEDLGYTRSNTKIDQGDQTDSVCEPVAV